MTAAIEQSELTVTAQGRRVLNCELVVAIPPGLVGLGILGAEDDQLRIDRLSLTR